LNEKAGAGQQKDKQGTYEEEVFHEINPRFTGLLVWKMPNIMSREIEYTTDAGDTPGKGEGLPRGGGAKAGVGCFRAVRMTLEGFGEFFRERALRRLLIGPAALDVLLACPVHGPLRGGSHRRSAL
jgi:hypothetical protein